MLEARIASYLGHHTKIKNTLTKDYLKAILEIAQSHVLISDLDQTIVEELVNMHVIKVFDDKAKLNTTVFLKEDMEAVIKLASSIGKELGNALLKVGSDLMKTSPEIRNFLGATIGVAQGLSKALRLDGKAVEWKDYTGKYAKTKVDFDEVCDLDVDLNKNMQNKSIIKGDYYTGVFIGHGGPHYLSFFNEDSYQSLSGQYNYNIMKYLTDSYGKLLSGKMNHESLKQNGEEVGIFENGHPKPILVTKEIFQQFASTIENISDVSNKIYSQHMDEIYTCLSQTTSGKQGVTPDSMMMHFGRYMRTILAQELYNSGFLTDDVPSKGMITVFYENDIQELNYFMS